MDVICVHKQGEVFSIVKMSICMKYFYFASFDSVPVRLFLRRRFGAQRGPRSGETCNDSLFISFNIYFFILFHFNGHVIDLNIGLVI